MALFEKLNLKARTSYQIRFCALNANGIKTIEEAKAICDEKGLTL